MGNAGFCPSTVVHTLGAPISTMKLLQTLVLGPLGPDLRILNPKPFGPNLPTLNDLGPTSLPFSLLP